MCVDVFADPDSTTPQRLNAASERSGRAQASLCADARLAQRRCCTCSTRLAPALVLLDVAAASWPPPASGGSASRVASSMTLSAVRLNGTWCTSATRKPARSRRRARALSSSCRQLCPRPSAATALMPSCRAVSTTRLRLVAALERRGAISQRPLAHQCDVGGAQAAILVEEGAPQKRRVGARVVATGDRSNAGEAADATHRTVLALRVRRAVVVAAAPRVEGAAKRRVEAAAAQVVAHHDALLVDRRGERTDHARLAPVDEEEIAGRAGGAMRDHVAYVRGSRRRSGAHLHGAPPLGAWTQHSKPEEKSLSLLTTCDQ